MSYINNIISNLKILIDLKNYQDHGCFLLNSYRTLIVIIRELIPSRNLD